MLSSVVILTAFLILWSAVHSLLASLPAKAWARRRLGSETVDRWYRLFYVVVSGLTLLPLPVLLRILPDRTLYIVPSPWSWLMVGGQLVGVAGLTGAVLQTGALRFVGLTQPFAPDPADEGPLQVRGLYCYVRHPIYAFSLLVLWLTPLMSVNLLAVYLLTSLYFYLGSLHEEYRLLEQFGEAYRHYQQRVPQLIPRYGRCYPPPEV
jgi:protein-S-isoprenylcysteine O-methyltransferase Ste14